MSQELAGIISSYQNTAHDNDRLYIDFTKKTDTVAFLKAHRDYIEKNNLGFGERAFAYMWYLLLQDVMLSHPKSELLEIGVFKGQIISLWQLIAQQIGWQTVIVGISPLKGNPAPKSALVKSLLTRVSKSFRKQAASANHYEETDYPALIKQLFTQFNLDDDRLQLMKGFSTDQNIISNCSEKVFSIIYIDGDHTFEGVMHDIKHYAGLVAPGGYLVMDDASCHLPGTKFWKGHLSVSDACQIIDELPFKNIFNVGHNRIYQRL